MSAGGGFQWVSMFHFLRGLQPKVMPNGGWHPGGEIWAGMEEANAGDDGDQRGPWGRAGNGAKDQQPGKDNSKQRPHRFACTSSWEPPPSPASPSSPVSPAPDASVAALPPAPAFGSPPGASSAFRPLRWAPAKLASWGSVAPLPRAKMAHLRFFNARRRRLSMVFNVSSLCGRCARFCCIRR